MKRCGIGPTFTLVTVGYGIVAGALTFRFPDLFSMHSVAYPAVVAPGLVLMVTGFYLYMRVLRRFGAGWEKGELITDGPYAVVRHPIYAAWILLIFPGVSLLFHSWLMLLLPLVAYGSFKLFIHREDTALETRYGQQYLEYRERVNELLPSWRQNRRQQ